MRKLSIAVVAVLVVALLGASAAIAKKDPVDVSASDFRGSGKAKAKIKGFGTEKGPMSDITEFGPQAGLAANEFRLTLDDGVDQIVIPGTWSLDERNKYVLVPDPTQMEQVLTDMFWDLAGGQLPGVTIDIEVTKLKLQPKPKVKKKTGETTWKFKVKIVFVVTASAMGVTEKVKVSLSYNGKGGKVI